MKIFGHPVHLMLIHFPSALFPMDLACSVAGYITGSDSFYLAGFYAVMAGAVLGWLAAISGMLDLGAITKKKPASVQKALIHGGINATVLIVYTVFAMIGYKKYPNLTKDSELLMGLKAVLVISLIVGNYVGGSLVLKDKVFDEG